MELKTTTYEVDGAVATITLSRPHRMNSWTGRMHTEYRWCLQQAENDKGIQVIVVTGNPEGRAFCAGADLAALDGHSKKGKYDAGIDESIATPGYGVRDEFDATFAYHFGLSKPVIAAINGAAAGVGLVLTAFCDLRFAVPGAKFTTAHGRFNFPAEFGLSWILPKLIGVTNANDVLLSSRVFTSDEAMEMGFLNKLLSLDELMPTVYEYAHKMAETVSPGSLRETKKQIYADMHRSASEAVIDSENLLNEMVKEPDYKEGVKAWSEKRPPEWPSMKEG